MQVRKNIALLNSPHSPSFHRKILENYIYPHAIRKSMKKKVILIADDEPHIIELIRLALGEEEYEYLEADTGKKVLELVEKKKPSLILLDIMMPVIDGYEVARRIRSNKANKEIVIAMVSAKKEDQDVLKGIDEGALAYITKPFNPMELEEKVKDLLNISNQED